MTKEIYNSLISIKDRLHDFDDIKTLEIAKLYEMQHLEHYHYEKDGKSVLAWKLTYKAIKEMEEYEKSLRQENREIKNLEIAKEANRISKESNAKSDKANRISIGSLITSIISALIAIGAFVVSILRFF